MENSTHQHEHSFINENVRNAFIVLFIFGIIAAISYFEWSGKLG